MILEALDLQQLTQKQEQIHLDHQLSVEHILPQKATLEQWPVPVYAQTSEAETQAYLNRRNLMLHTIGNLTLLTQPLNSIISNGSFARKQPEITQQSSLRLNSYFQKFSIHDTWDEMTISKRGTELFEDALKIWPQPE